MRKFPRLLFRFAAAAACLVLGACFDVREEVWIHRDGSGRAELRYTVPESVLRLTGGAEGLEEKIVEFVAGQPQLALESMQVRVEQERAVIDVSIATDSMLSLRNLGNDDTSNRLPAAAKEMAGRFDVRLRGLDIDFSRSIHLREALGLAALAVGREDREQRRLTYIIHLPKAAKESNATSTGDGGRTLVWENTLGDALKAPVVTRFRATMPVPWWVWAGLAGLASASGIFFLRRRKRSVEITKKSTSPP